MTEAIGASTYLEAIREGLIEEMRRDPRVLCVGEDIGHFGGAFKVTAGLLDEFGPERVVDTPIAESLIVGFSIGCALRGLRPVAEMQFADFVASGFSQIVHNAATFHYRLGISVPIVIRLPAGGGIGGGPFHSWNPEAWFAHVPGLKVVAPATPRDAKGLLLTAIRDPDPVIYLEQKYLYRRQKEDLAGAEAVPFGVARIAREGRHITIVTYANGVSMSLEAADLVSREGLDVEVIDLRTLVPWDWEAVVRSVRKTGRALVVSESTRTAGFAAEIGATLADLCFEHLDAPIRRVSSIDAPVPAEAGLEAYFRPNKDKIAEGLRLLATW